MANSQQFENGASFLGLITGACASGVIVSQGGYGTTGALILSLSSSVTFAVIARVLAKRAREMADRLRRSGNK